ncbi:hypothetical protein VTP01DRAFT_4031 [Rhizomucor pusillus]|uniref:uncharacterized protein n=1 Tax=Rhizomucor pusillus TaxID=4840 RepID=UPI003742D475
MGIAGLHDLTKPIQNSVHLSEFEGQTVGIDANGWLHKAVFGFDFDPNMDAFVNALVDYCLRQIMLLLHFGIKPYLVFDGAPLPMKQAAHEERKARREKAFKEAQKLIKQGNRKAAVDHLKKSLEITLDVVQQVAKILTDKGFRCLVAPFEADAQLTFLMAMKKISAVITEDSDLLVYGCDTIIFKLNNQTGQGVQVKSRDLVKIPGFQGWTHERFRHMCILSGWVYQRLYSFIVSAVWNPELGTALHKIDLQQYRHSLFFTVVPIWGRFHAVSGQAEF